MECFRMVYSEIFHKWLVFSCIYKSLASEHEYCEKSSHEWDTAVTTWEHSITIIPMPPFITEKVATCEQLVGNERVIIASGLQVWIIHVDFA